MLFTLRKEKEVSQQVHGTNPLQVGINRQAGTNPLQAGINLLQAGMNPPVGGLI